MSVITSKLPPRDQQSSPVAVSVIVPVRNRPVAVARCIESLLRSDYPPSHLELICVDNGSTDNTPAVLEGYSPRVRVVSELTPGPGAARNAGIRVASGERIAFTDSDCIVEPDWVRRIVAPLDEPEIGIVGGRILAQRPCSPVALLSLFEAPTAKADALVERIVGIARQSGEPIAARLRAAIEGFYPPYVISMNIAMRCETLAALGGFDERLLRCEDVDLSVRAVQAGLRLAYCDEAVIHHRNRDSLWELMREGFQHGYYAPQLLEIHEDYYRAAREEGGDRPASSVARVEPEVAPWRCELYGRLFQASKSLGRIIGRRIARPLPQPCTTSGT